MFVAPDCSIKNKQILNMRTLFALSTEYLQQKHIR